MAILVNTSALLAYFYERDPYHQAAARIIDPFSGETLLVPTPVLPELFDMLSTSAEDQRAIQEDGFTPTSFSIVPLGAEFDDADTAIMALAERLKIAQVFTVDRFDFAAFRPQHADALTLLP